MFRYKVISSKLLTRSVRLVSLRLPDDETPLLFQPGQYAAISLHDKARPTTNRCFSITSSSNDKRAIQFSIRIGGKFTSALERLKPGDEVDVRGPFGGFVFTPKTHDDLVMFAGGIGVAPFISMVRYACELKLENKLHLIYSVRDQRDIPFIDEVTKLEKSNSNLTVTYFVGGGDVDKIPSNRIIMGRVDQKGLKKAGVDMTKQTFMICGPPPYMNAVHKLLEVNGAPQDKILSEAFSQSNKKQTGKLRDWPFNMYAITGLSMLAIGFFVVANDLYTTLPKLKTENIITPSAKNDLIKVSSGSLYDQINTVPPTVDTNITPATPKAVAPVPKATESVVKKVTPVYVAPRPVVVPRAAPICTGSGC